MKRIARDPRSRWQLSNSKGVVHVAGADDPPGKPIFGFGYSERGDIDSIESTIAHRNVIIEAAGLSIKRHHNGSGGKRRCLLQSECCVIRNL